MRRPLALSLVAVVLTVAVSAASAREVRRSAPLPANATFLITGHGWGHGVGLSQYGAYGYAQHGWTYQRIVGHYYTGTELGTEPSQKIRVLLAGGSASLKLGSASAFTVRDATGATHDVAPGTYTLTASFKLKVDNGTKPVRLQQPLLFQPGTSPLTLGRRYRGSIQVELNAGRLRAINVVGLEQYLYGVVPSEVPYSWSPEALKAQAVVARSYALATKRSGGPFDVYPDTRSQMYLGLDHERPSTTAAVEGTAGQVVLYNGQVAKTYFYSTSGGRTASAQDVWGTPVPYLVSVPDPYDTISPYHNWGPLAFSGARLGRVLRAGGAVVDARPTVNSSGRVTTLTVFTANGQRSFSGGSLRKVLGLRSTWFSVGVLALGGPGTAVSYGSTARLSGVARGISPVTLQQRTAGVWQKAVTVTPAHDGTVAVAVRPTVTTDYRLASGKVVGGLARVPVAPVIRIVPPRTQSALQGTVRPVVTGAAVTIQRQEGTTWVPVARTTVDTAGSFAAQLQLTSGTYRARVTPGHGLVPGVSPVLQVSTS
jgi:stage II sporulation protein D